MKLAVQQPFFFPYLAYFDLINRVDRWIAFDTAQYVKWVSRNRILHPVSGWQYILIPVKKHRRETPIREIEISTNTDWKGLIIRQMRHYAKGAPYYREVIHFLEDCFSDEDTNLARVVIALQQKTCRRLGIETRIDVYSEMSLTLPGLVQGPGDWGLMIAQAAGADEYVSLPLPPGVTYMDANRYQEKGVRLTHIPASPMIYSCGRFQYEPNLSIIDVMMWNAPDEIKRHLDANRSRDSRGA